LLAPLEDIYPPLLSWLPGLRWLRVFEHDSLEGIALRSKFPGRFIIGLLLWLVRLTERKEKKKKKRQQEVMFPPDWIAGAASEGGQS